MCRVPTCWLSCQRCLFETVYVLNVDVMLTTATHTEFALLQPVACCLELVTWTTTKYGIRALVVYNI